MTCLSASFNFTQHGTDNLKRSVTMMMTAQLHSLMHHKNMVRFCTKTKHLSYQKEFAVKSSDRKKIMAS